MRIQRLNDETLLVPKRIEGNSIIVDAMEEIKPIHVDYKKYLAEYQREQELELNEKK